MPSTGGSAGGATPNTRRISDVPVSDADTDVGNSSGLLSTGTGATTPHDIDSVMPSQMRRRTPRRYHDA